MLLLVHYRRPSETVAWARARCLETTVLVLTAYDVDDYLAAMVTAGEDIPVNVDRSRLVILTVYRWPDLWYTVDVTGESGEYLK